jgi:hypothetical protein
VPEDVSTFYLTSPAMAPEKSFDGAWLTWELLLLQSPPMALEKILMSMNAFILVDSVGPPSVEVC